MSNTFERATRIRAKRLKNLTEQYEACQCEFPVRVLRNLHGHGKTADGRLCPAIGVWERQRDEADEAKLIAEEA